MVNYSFLQPELLSLEATKDDFYSMLFENFIGV